MAEVRKPGSHGKLASVLGFLTPKTQIVSHQHFTDFLKILPFTSAT